MNIKAIHTAILVSVLGLATAACTISPGIEGSYGDAVRSNVKAQVYDPATLASPSDDPVEGTDGQRMEAVMEAHRGHEGSAQSVASPIVINVGNQ